MFQKARLELTGWYVLILIIISGIFTAAFYRSSTREIQRLIDRIEFSQEQHGDVQFVPPGMIRNFPSLEELREIKQQTLVQLLFVNGGVVILSAFASYWLAGKTLEPIERMMEDQKIFIANASHELRTPLATLRAEIESSLMEKKMTTKKARAVLKSNLEEIETLEKLSSSLLQMLELEATVTSTDFEDLEVSSILVDVVKKLTPVAKKKEIQIETSLKQSFVFASHEQLQQVFSIILDNAIKYSGAKGTIKIQMVQNAHSVNIRFQDDGIGIAAHDLEHIFERFYRADASRSQDGFGVGLSIAQSIVTAHGGKISVKSSLGKGTTFVVQLPKIAHSI